METNELYRGRLIDHLHFVVKDLKASKKFYTAIMSVLKIPVGGEGENFIWFDELFLSDKEPPMALGQLTGRTHLAFQAENEEMVKAFYEAALKAGGKDNGAPGYREYHPGYYGAFVIDPDGNNIEAVFHGNAKRSSPSVKITY